MRTVSFQALATLTILLARNVLLDAQDDKGPRNSVIKIIATRRNPDHLKPWTKSSPEEILGTGVVIDGERILTNAHVVMHSSQIYVQAYESSDKVTATVQAIAPTIDLALLKVEKAGFFASLPALPMADALPKVKDSVSVYGYPVGGTQLSVTDGIVSRIEFVNYYYNTSGLRLQVDAALNPGNSGGPAVSQGKMIGVVFSYIPNQQKTGYLIPIEEIKMFLEDIQDGVYDGKPQVFDSVQNLENGALRSLLKLDDKTTGVMVNAPYRKDPAYPLKERDVLTHIGGVRIENDSLVNVEKDLRLHYTYFVTKFAKGGTVEFTVLRDGQSMKVAVPVAARKDTVAGYLKEKYPRYFIYGPLVFSPLSYEFLWGLGPEARASLSTIGVTSRAIGPVAFPGQEMVVVASSIFPHPIVKGYEDPPGYIFVLSKVNGMPIKNLRHLVEVLRDASGTYIEFGFEGLYQSTMVFRRTEILAATEEILTDNGIRYQYSEDLRDLAAPAKK